MDVDSVVLACGMKTAGFLVKSDGFTFDYLYSLATAQYHLQGYSSWISTPCPDANLTSKLTVQQMNALQLLARRVRVQHQ